MADQQGQQKGQKPPAPKKGFFSSKQEPSGPDVSGMTQQLNSMAARIRVVEQRNSELRKKILLIEQNMLSNHKRAMEEIKHLRDDMSETKRSIQTVEDRIITIIKELRLMATKEQVDVMKRYLDLWNPVKFVPASQIEQIIDEKLAQKMAPRPAAPKKRANETEE